MSDPKVYYVPDELLDPGHARARPAEPFERRLVEKSAYDALAEKMKQAEAERDEWKEKAEGFRQAYSIETDTSDQLRELVKQGKLLSDADNKRIHELERSLDDQIGQWIKAKDEANVLGQRVRELEAATWTKSFADHSEREARFVEHKKLDIMIVWTNTVNGLMPWSPSYRVENELTALRAQVSEYERALESSNKTLRYAQEEYARGHGVTLMFQTIEYNLQLLAKHAGKGE